MHILRKIDILFLIIISGCINGFLLNANLNKFTSIIKVIQLIIYFILIIRFIKLKYAKFYGIYNAFYIFIGYCIINSLLSDNFKNSIITIIFLILNSIYAYFIYKKYDLNMFIRMLSTAMGFAMLGSFIISILFPNIGTYYDSNYAIEVWRGMFTHKNTLGGISAMSILVLLLNYKINNKKIISLILIVISAINLFFAGSNTPLYVLILIVLYILIEKGLRKDFAMSIFFTSSIINYLYLFKFNLDISGRKEIYINIIKLIKERFVAGYGIGICWLEGSYPYTYILNILRFNPNSSHNGYLEICLNLGIVGLVMYLIIIYSIFRANKVLFIKKSQYCKLIILVLYLILVNIFESSLANYNSVYWIIQCYCFFSLVGETKREYKYISEEKFYGESKCSHTSI